MERSAFLLTASPTKAKSLLIDEPATIIILLLKASSIQEILLTIG